ncbi:phage protein NinX family protein [Variovorax boronicumulans]|uniref:phage protein NinX family protein n=1 Tax=Variovorax boronicumulans TaxID=436515 RepID=UPI0027859507|nr:phage protein NinX family protein [Variovorax boronicumulans]MDQ0040803.1 hypothetical protein [Variovorax boronicumulans]
MNTADLSGAELDYWTARADGKHPVISSLAGKLVCLVDGLPYAPSSNWQQAGLLIEREKIMIARGRNHWIAGVSDFVDRDAARICKGPTALTAAMRALVQAKCGDFVVEGIQASRPSRA